VTLGGDVPAIGKVSVMAAREDAAV